MNGLGFDKVSSILCLGAHPDDIEIGCGATLLQLLDSHLDVTVHWHVFSGASKRKQEAIEGASRFLAGAADQHVYVHPFRDSFFPEAWADIKRSFADLQSLDPDIVFTHRLEDRHQDHRVLAELTWNAFRNHSILEYEIPKYEADLATPNAYVGFDESICERKINHLVTAHASQAEKPWFRPELFRGLMSLRAIESGSGHRFAEAFHCRKLRLNFTSSA